jgi:D-alanyl-D-alanine carboxypeptidase
MIRENNDAEFNDLSDLLDEQSSSDQFSGVVLITQNGKTTFEYVTGFANKEQGIKNSLETQFNIGSMDKMFTAVAIAQLAEKKLLSFDDLISKYINNLPNTWADKMTIYHVLTHQEGFSSYFNKKYIEKRLELKTVNDYMDLFINEPLLFEPGEKYSYSNSCYV